MATGRMLYEHMMANIAIPAAANHEIWYAGEQEKLGKPESYAFRGNIPEGRTLELITLTGKPIPGRDLESTSPHHYTFQGSEESVLVSDLSDSAKAELGIPSAAQGKDKVFNRNFRPYDKLDEHTKISNELAALSVPKSISSWFGGRQGKVNYSEKDVLSFLEACLDDLSGPEMSYILHANHMAWCALAYIRSKGNVAGDIGREFYGQQPADFYVKDLGTVLPAMFFSAALLGQDPVKLHDKLDTEIWGVKKAAHYMRRFMPREEKEAAS